MDFGLDCVRKNNFCKGPFFKKINARKIPLTGNYESNKWANPICCQMKSMRGTSALKAVLE